MPEDSTQQLRELLDNLYRSDSRQVLATLIRLLDDFDAAEEALHDAFAVAVEQWARDGRSAADCARGGTGPHHDALCVNLPELGTLTHKEVAALAGAAPFPRDSGTLKGRRAMWGGRAHMRAALYMAALVATRKNPVMRTFYQRLCQPGKAKKLALTACTRKLLTILNAMLKSGTPWRVAASQPV